MVVIWEKLPYEGRMRADMMSIIKMFGVSSALGDTTKLLGDAQNA